MARKLTKTQVKKMLQQMGKLKAKLAMDKLEYADSNVPMSTKVILDLDRVITNAFKRVK
tara:strand:+ start:2521 stop:2697 length:177 start_codon:yes stop_codon:yes gene_type:complete